MELLLYENENLKMSMSKQTQELQTYQKASLTQDQTASLLQELKVLQEELDNAHKSKSFFKEQWGKAVREIHRMKMDNQRAMEVQIKNSKEELKNVEYVHFQSYQFPARLLIYIFIRIYIFRTYVKLFFLTCFTKISLLSLISQSGRSAVRGYKGFEQ